MWSLEVAIIKFVILFDNLKFSEDSNNKEYIRPLTNI